MKHLLKLSLLYVMLSTTSTVDASNSTARQTPPQAQKKQSSTDLYPEIDNPADSSSNNTTHTAPSSSQKKRSSTDLYPEIDNPADSSSNNTRHTAPSSSQKRQSSTDLFPEEEAPKNPSGTTASQPNTSHQTLTAKPQKTTQTLAAQATPSTSPANKTAQSPSPQTASLLSSGEQHPYRQLIVQRKAIPTDTSSYPAVTNSKLLGSAARLSFPEWVEFLLGQTPAEKVFIANVTQYETTTEKFAAHHLSAWRDDAESFNHFLAHDAAKTLTTTTDQGNTPLHIACREGSEAIVKLILERSDLPQNYINLRNNKGFTPLFLACREGRASIVSLLLQHRADKTIASNNRKTPLIIARYNLGKILLGNGDREQNGILYRSIIKQLRNLDNVNEDDATTDSLSKQEASTGNADEEMSDITLPSTKAIIEESIKDNQASNTPPTPSTTSQPQTTAESEELKKTELIDDMNALETVMPSLKSQLDTIEADMEVHNLAAARGEARLNRLLNTPQGKAALSTRDTSGMIPLHYAALNHNPSIIDNLIKAMKAAGIAINTTVNNPSNRFLHGKNATELAKITALEAQQQKIAINRKPEKPESRYNQTLSYLAAANAQ